MTILSDFIEPFTINIPQADLDDLRTRLLRARLPEAIPGVGWDYGVDMDYLRSLLDYWRTDYDWRAAEARLNEFDHFRTRIQGHLIHFVHIRSQHANATPLLMVHGWPGSIVEFLGVIDRLVAPERHGGDAADAFHLVLPSLPGYGFSEPPRERGWGPARAAEVFAELMSRLGYDRYGVQGGDWGAIVAAEMGLADRGRLIGLHTNMPMAPTPDVAIALTAQEEIDVADMAAFARDERAYAALQGSKPQTLGVGLNDSPAGLCAWIIEKFRSWSDCDGRPETAIDRDALLTNISLYWLTGTATSSARLYHEFFHATRTWDKGKVETPTGVARFPKEMHRPPRAWVERSYNLVRWTEMPRGGHFAAFEQPAPFANDVRAFFRQLQGGNALQP